MKTLCQRKGSRTRAQDLNSESPEDVNSTTDLQTLNRRGPKYLVPLSRIAVVPRGA